MSSQIPQIRTHVPQFAFQMRVLPGSTHEMLSCIPERLPCLHHNHEKPNPVGNESSAGKVPRNRGVVGWFLCKAVPRQGVGGGVYLTAGASCQGHLACCNAHGPAPPRPPSGVYDAGAHTAKHRTPDLPLVSATPQTELRPMEPCSDCSRFITSSGCEWGEYY